MAASIARLVTCHLVSRLAFSCVCFDINLFLHLPYYYYDVSYWCAIHLLSQAELGSVHQHEAAEIVALRSEVAQARDDTARLAREHAREVSNLVRLWFLALCIVGS